MTPTDDLDFGSILHYFELGNFFGSELESLTIGDWTSQAQFLYGLLDEFQLLADENFGVAPPAGGIENSDFVAGTPDIDFDMLSFGIVRHLVFEADLFVFVVVVGEPVGAVLLVVNVQQIFA